MIDRAELKQQFEQLDKRYRELHSELVARKAYRNTYTAEEDAKANHYYHKFMMGDHDVSAEELRDMGRMEEPSDHPHNNLVIQATGCTPEEALDVMAEMGLQHNVLHTPKAYLAALWGDHSPRELMKKARCAYKIRFGKKPPKSLKEALRNIPEHLYSAK